MDLSLPVCHLGGDIAFYSTDFDEDFPASFPENIVDEDTLLADEIVWRAERSASVREWISSLSPSLQRVYDSIYVRGLNTVQTAAAMGVSHARVSQLHKRLLELGTTALAEVIR